MAATLSAPSYPKFVVSHSVAGLGVHFGYKPSVAAFNSNLQATKVPMFSSNIGAQDFSLSTGSQDKHFSASSLQFFGEVADTSAPSMHFLGENEGNLWHKASVLPRRQKSLLTTRACKDDTFEYHCPVITEKPDWWWRTLACVPYLIALQTSQAGFFIQPFLEHYGMFENLIYFVPGTITRYPPWFSKVYKYLGRIGIVKNKDMPHFIRFHMMMAMLLKIGLQVVCYAGNLFPFIQNNGMFEMHFWAIIGFCFILMLLECVRCALVGKYPHIPFVSEAAYAHTRFDIVSFERPF